jgi:transcription elongation factor GreA
VIEATEGKKGEVVLGSRVTVVEKGTQNKEIYYVVGSAEAKPSEGKISLESPLGKALMGAKVGEKVKVQAPDGELVFTIKEIA